MARGPSQSLGSTDLACAIADLARVIWLRTVPGNRARAGVRVLGGPRRAICGRSRVPGARADI